MSNERFVRRNDWESICRQEQGEILFFYLSLAKYAESWRNSSSNRNRADQNTRKFIARNDRWHKMFFFCEKKSIISDQNYLDDHLVKFIWNVYFQWTKNDIFYRIGINFTLCIDYSNFVIDRKQRRSWQREPNETCFHKLVGKLGNIQLLRYCNFINCPVWKRRGRTRDFSFRNSKFMPVHVENRTDDKSSGCEVRAVLLAAFCLRNGIGNCAYINRLGWRLFKNK